MAGIITTGSLPKLLWPGINQIFGFKYDNYKPEWSDIFGTFTSDKRFEEDVAIANMGLAVVKNEGSAIAYDSFRQNYVKRYVHVVYAKGFSLTKEVQADIQYSMQLSTVGAGMLADSLNQTKEFIGANVFNNATSTAQTYVGGDGVALLSASHPTVASGNQSNLASADISELVLEDAVISIQGFLDDAGKRIMIRPAKLLIPKESMFIVERILKSTNRAATGDNDINALRSMGLIPEVVVNHFLTDTDFWMIKTDVSDDQGFRHFKSMGYELETDVDFNTKNLLTTALERYSFGFSNWRCAYGSLGV